MKSETDQRERKTGKTMEKSESGSGQEYVCETAMLHQQGGMPSEVCIGPLIHIHIESVYLDF